MADLDNDGDLDMVSGSGAASEGEVRAWQNDGTPFGGTWSSSVVSTTADAVNAVAVGDFDRDGNLDIVVGCGSGEDYEMIVWQNDGTPFDGGWVANDVGASVDHVFGVAVGDVDNDGDLDVVSASASGADYEIIVWENEGTPFSGLWTGHDVGITSDTAWSVALGDLDADGWLDVVVGTGTMEDYEVIAWQNDSTPFDGIWFQRDVGSTEAGARAIIIGDWDGDGDADIASAGGSGAGGTCEIVVWQNDGTPFYSVWSGNQVGIATNWLFALTAADLDNDGDLDLITGGGTDNDYEVVAWQNSASPFSGGWALATLGSSVANVRAVAAGDLDSDGDMDVVSSSESGEDYELIVWENTLLHRNMPFDGDGSLTGTSADDINALSIVDLDGDGDLDVITGAGSDAAVNVVAWQNNGSPFDGTWSSSGIGAAGSDVWAIAVGDLDNDGRPDVVSGASSTPRLQMWQNDGTPFNGAWPSYTLTEPPAAVDSLALGDLDNDGDLDLVVGTGPHFTYAASDSYRILVYENDGTPFDGTWGTITNVAIISYTVHALALGDLDSDGWQDVVAGVHHAPGLGSEEDPVPSSEWPDVYELRAYRNDGTPFAGIWGETNVGRDPETVTFETGHYHGYWGAAVWAVALSDLDNDGDLDIISCDGIEADYQIKVWENDGTPFDGQPQEQHWTWSPTAVWFGQSVPWMNGSAYAVDTTDFNADGWPDLVTGSSWGEVYEIITWENSGEPFGDNITDTTWIRRNVGSASNTHAYAVGTADLDEDGDPDIVSGHSVLDRSYNPAPYELMTWQNQGGSITEYVISTAPAQITEGSTDDLLRISVSHNGLASDNDAELAEWRLLFEESSGDPLSSDEANALIETLYVYRDTNGNQTWQIDDTPILTVTNLSLTDGVQVLTFTNDDPWVRQTITSANHYFVVVEAKGGAAAQTPSQVMVTFDPDADSIVRDRVEDTSVSIRDTVPVSTDLITFVGPSTHVLIETAPDGTGEEVGDVSLSAGDSLTVYAIARDAGEHFVANVAVTWVLTNTTGGVVGGDLVPAGDNRSATFTGHLVGTTRIEAQHATLDDDVTGVITVTPGAPASIALSVVPDETTVDGSIALTATVRDQHDNPVPDAGVSFSTALPTGVLTPEVDVTDALGEAHSTLTATAPGTGMVTATVNGLEAASAVTFTVGALDYIVLSPASVTIAAGSAQAYTAEAFDSLGHSLGDVTSGTVFSISTEADGECVDNICTARKVGTWTVTGVYQGKQDNASLTVEPGELHHFYVDAPDSGQAGIPFRVTITALDPFDNVITDFAADVTLATDAGTISPAIAPAAGFVNGVWQGWVTLSQGGNRLVIATYEGRTGQDTIELSAPSQENFMVYLPIVLRQ
ncbi:MAG: VCBS repeat-containing protein [Anaerolineae bacterium]|nr:VCBS repeat-containing protein [Anaerolineae bacterium]